MLAVLFDWLIFEPLPSVSTSLNTPPAGRIELTVTAPYGSGPVIWPIMPHRILSKVSTEISNGRFSVVIGMDPDVSNRTSRGINLNEPSPMPEK